MAKGSLLGKTDSTLAAMSYKEAMADVTPDLKDVYSAEALNQALFQTGVEGYFDKLYADNNALADELKEATTAAMADLSSGAIPDDEGMELYNTYLTGLKDKMKSIPKGKKGDFERSKIRAELSRLKNSTSEMDETLITLGTMIENDQFNSNATSNENLAILTAIANKKAKREIVNGNLIYSIPNPEGKDIKMTQSELRDAIVQSNPKEQSGFIKIGSGWNTKGKQTGTEFDPQGAVNAYKSSFLTKKGFADNIHTVQGSLKYTFAEALSGKDPELANSIYKTLMDMGETTIAKYDADDSGTIDAADFANAENGVTLVKALTDIHAKDENGESIFDFQTAKEVAAKFYADNIAKKEFDDGTKMRTKKVDKGDGKGETGTKKFLERGGFSYSTNSTGFDDAHPDESKRNRVINIGYEQQMANRNSLLPKNTTEGSEIQGEHYVYKFNGKTWQAFYNGEVVKDVKGSQIAQWEGLLSPIDIQNGKSYAMFNVGTKTSKLSQEQEEKAPNIPGGIGLGVIESSSVNQVKVNLQNILSPQFATDFNVNPVYKSLYSLEQKGQVRRIVKNKIKITGPGGFEKIYNIGPDATSEIADQITADLTDYIKIDPLNPN